MTHARKIVVPAGVGSLAALRAQFPLGDDELADGRIFVGRVRATTFETAIREGALVRVEAAAPARVGEATILDEDADLLIADKPADWVTVAELRGRGRALLDALAEARRLDPRALHPTSRLDLGVSGVVTFAKTAVARERLAALRESGAYARAYLAVAHGGTLAANGVWDAPIGRDRDPKRRCVGGPDAKPARSRFERIATTPDGRFALLLLFPETGRTHQLRVHAAHAGAPLAGDRAYGPGRPLVAPGGAVVPFDRIALHCHRVRLGPPFARIAASPPPPALAALWTRMGGATSDLEALVDAAAKRLPAP